MSEPKFTPGPWKVTDKEQFVRTTDGRDRIVAEAIFIPHVVPKEEREANARLIAAAPVLYAAVEAALERFDDEIHCRPPRRHALKYAQDLRDALAKAVGP